MFIEIITPDGKIFENNLIEQISVNTEDGYITVLPDHTKLTATLIPGELEVVTANETDFIAIGQGLIRIADNNITILVDTANTADTIDENTSEEARKRAEELLNNVDAMDEEEISRIQADLSRELAKLNVLKLSRTRFKR